MSSQINPRLLKPHAKNQEYYNDLPDEKYQEIKRSIEANGIRDPLKVLPDFTVLAGHQRLKIALELGLDHVPVEIQDVSNEEAEYLLVADNEERRQLDDDPIRKAKRAKFLKEYWGVRNGGDRRSVNQNGELKTAKDIADTIGIDAPHLPRLLKLNDLIPELQSLVSLDKLGTTAAEQLAYLTPEIQQELYKAMGESIADLTLNETKNLRSKAAEVEQLQKALTEANSRAVEAEESMREAQMDLADLKESLDDTVEEVTKEAAKKEKDKAAKLEAKINDLQEKLKNLEQSKKAEDDKVKTLQDKLTESQKKMADATKEQDRKLQEQLSEAKSEIERLKSLPPDNPEADRQIKEKEEQIRHLDREIASRRAASVFVRQLRDTLNALRDMELGFNRGDLNGIGSIEKKEIEYHVATLRHIANVMEDTVLHPKEGQLVLLSKTRGDSREN